jgi:hypothetical protein
MKVDTKYNCEICESTFLSESECVSHEENCKPHIESFTCDKCGEKEEWEKNDVWAETNHEGCHYINLGQMGYGSGLDGSNVNFQICDKCLIGFVKSFTLEGQEKIFNSGSSHYMSSEDWIRETKGEFSDEDYEAHGMYSPRQRKAYEERFPVCDEVSINVYKDGSQGSSCIMGAFGNKDGTAEGHQSSTRCFGCELFETRKEGKEIPIVMNN